MERPAKTYHARDRVWIGARLSSQNTGEKTVARKESAKPAATDAERHTRNTARNSSKQTPAKSRSSHVQVTCTGLMEYGVEASTAF